MTYLVTTEQFLKEIQNHNLEIKKDDGLYRHLVCKQPGTMNQSFNIVTAPGYLFYYGDMGSFTFCRVDDMFRFFRSDELSINEGYWAEKLQAVDRVDGFREFSFDLFTDNLLECCETNEQKEFIRDELGCCDQDEYGAVEFIRNFDNDNEHGVDLSDFFEYRNHVPTTRYLWCCYAIVWAIQQYDHVKLEAA